MDPTWRKLKRHIQQEGLSGFSGIEVGLSRGQLQLKRPPHDLTPRPTIAESKLKLDPAIWKALPDRGLPYPELQKFVFGCLPKSFLIGNTTAQYVGYANDDKTRIEGASGGVLTQALLYLLKTKRITGAVVSRLSASDPTQPETFIARTEEDIRSAAGSIYTESSPLTILADLVNESGPLAFVGLPDHVAAIRMLQKLQHPSVKPIKYILGPYTGTILKHEAISSYLKSNNARVNDVEKLTYRAGEWPGYLEIKLKDGRVLRAEKFYYNYLIPFFITHRTSRLAVDFTNELTDISVGDAWAPEYEKKRGGYSVVLARSKQGNELLQEMKKVNLITLHSIEVEKVVSMHSHMIDFKKRGTFIRMQWRKKFGKPSPSFGYYPKRIPTSRYITECVISSLFWIGSTKLARTILPYIPITILGPLFNTLRLSWKKVSAPNKRSGLFETEFIVDSSQ